MQMTRVPSQLLHPIHQSSFLWLLVIRNVTALYTCSAVCIYKQSVLVEILVLSASVRFVPSLGCLVLHNWQHLQ